MQLKIFPYSTAESPSISLKPNPYELFFTSISKQFRDISTSAGDEEKISFNRLQNLRGILQEDGSKLFKYATIAPDLEKLKEFLLNKPDFIMERDPLGASVIHNAYIFIKPSEILQNKFLRRWLVENFPEEALKPFSETTKYNKKLDDENYILPFAGENILHICIVKRDIDEINWLFDHFDKSKDSDGELCINRLLNGRAYGSFFDLGTHCYFGEYPLLFAVCSNDKQIVDLILSKSPKDAIFTTVDRYGNNALHMCIIHDLQDMYAHIENEARKKIKEIFFDNRSNNNAKNGLNENDVFLENLTDDKEQYLDNLSEEERTKKIENVLMEKLVRALNNDKHTVFILAASKTGSLDMFRYLIERKKTVYWEYGNIVDRYLDMAELELVDTTKRDDCMFGAIEWLCRDDQKDKLELKEIENIIRKKWTRIGYESFLIAGVYSFFVTALFTLLICLETYPMSIDQYRNFYYVASNTIVASITNVTAIHDNNSTYWFLQTTNVTSPDYSTLPSPLSHTEINAITALYVFIGTLLVVEGLSEFPLLVKVGLDYWGWSGGIRGAARFDKICSTLLFFLFAGAAISKYRNDEFYTKVILGFCGIISWARQYVFLMGFEITGRLLLIAYRICATDLVRFAQFYLVVLFGFGSAFSLLSSTVDVGESDFANYYTTIWNTLLYTVDNNQGGIDVDNYPTEFQQYFQFVNVAFRVIISFLMFNVLIAMMNDSFSQVYAISKVVLYREQYNIMCGFERVKTQLQLKERQKKYTMKKKHEDKRQDDKKQDDTDVFFEYKEKVPNWWTSKDKKKEKYLKMEEKLQKVSKLYENVKLHGKS
eukprot:gene807-1571_t